MPAGLHCPPGRGGGGGRRAVVRRKGSGECWVGSFRGLKFKPQLNFMWTPPTCHRLKRLSEYKYGHFTWTFDFPSCPKETDEKTSPTLLSWENPLRDGLTLFHWKKRGVKASGQKFIKLEFIKFVWSVGASQQTENTTLTYYDIIKFLWQTCHLHIQQTQRSIHLWKVLLLVSWSPPTPEGNIWLLSC